jgi:hypothetical protein
MISSRVRVGKDTYSGGNRSVGYGTEITVSSSIEDRTKSIPAGECHVSTDCSKLNRYMVKGGSAVCD